MQREVALVYSRDARPAGSSETSPDHYAPGQAAGARPMPGITEFVEQTIETASPASCSATTRAGNPCKAFPVGGSDLCVGHTNQARAGLGDHEAEL
jgi:hypothetical protein